MKTQVKFSWAVVLILLLSASGFSQISVKKGLVLGFANTNMSSDSESENQKSKNGILGGLSLELDFLGPLAIEANALYFSKGVKSESGDQTSTFSANYLEIPVMAKFDFPAAPTLSYHIYGGPALGFKLSESSDTESGGDNTDTLTGSDFSAVFGAGFSVGAAALDVSLGVRYILGLSNVSNSDSGDTKHPALALVAGISL